MAAVKAVSRMFRCLLTRHAQQACFTDRYGKIVPPTSIIHSADNIVEIEVENNSPIKVVVRLPYDTQRDVIIAFIPDFDTAIVKTCWFNLKTDQHRTLDTSRYSSVKIS